MGELPPPGQPDPGGVLIFAYGSNMLTRRIRARAPSALSIGIAEIRGHRMTFDKRGADGSGKGNIREVSDPAERVHGVIYRVDIGELAELDRVEGGYERCEVAVITRSGHSVSAFTYRALDTFVEPRLRPFLWYRSLVLAGAREHRLPPDHVLWIECQAADPDPDDARRRRHLRLLAPPGS
jgi:gamma-glutamylcyclotransferase